MRQWADDHPKAKILARKRAAILEAAREAFLRAGYEGAAMEAIAASAGVSIMTLYRHAESKDDLFAAVMLNECARAHGDEDNTISLDQPLRPLLVQAGVQFQDRLLSQDTISLFRAVMVETARFPHVSEAAYNGFIGAWEREIDAAVAGRAEFKEVTALERSVLIANFIDDLVGVEFLRRLFGLVDDHAEKRRMQRSEAATEKFLSGLRRDARLGQT